MARATAATLIEYVRGVLHDPAGADQQFSDSQIQAALDEYRLDVELLLLERAYSTPTYAAPVSPWETATLTDASGQTLTPATEDLWNGRWTFQEQDGAVYATGIVHDVYAAIAYLLDAWAAAEALSFDVDVDGQALKRSQKHEQLLRAAERFRRMARPRMITMERSDAT